MGQNHIARLLPWSNVPKDKPFPATVRQIPQNTRVVARSSASSLHLQRWPLAALALCFFRQIISVMIIEMYAQCKRIV
jgi:hypothetical protein